MIYDMKENYSILLKYIPYFENGQYKKIIPELRDDAAMCLKQYEDLDTVDKTEAFLLDVYNKSGEMNMDYFSMNIQGKSGKVVVALINIALVEDMWRDDMVDILATGGWILRWLYRLKELNEVSPCQA